MPRLYSDLQSSLGRRYYFGLTSAPGGVNPAQAELTVSGLAPTIFQQSTVFRTPAPAVITVNGQQVVTDVALSPASALVSVSGQVPDKLTTKIITNSLPLDYTDLPDNAPTILFISTIVPGTGLVQLQSLELNVTPGGNIGFISPLVGTVTLQGRQPVFVFFEVGAGSVVAQGLAPTLHTTLVVEPSPALIQLAELMPHVDPGFVWIDVDPPPAVTWTTTTGIAA